jgi:hypothetical protein
MRCKFFFVLAFAGSALLGCPARSPADEDACLTDSQCGGGLVCCHSSDEALGSRQSTKTMDRGFCVKSAVCDTVAAPPQAPLPQE